ncbi:formyltetrahydrofolate deformylase [Aquirufa aurantiipilula]|uniref:Formyltetrahydrofolate deformylase n=1 Tax=Aquirufa aurantiipilula TaxID=2696561 RepID=A0ABT6BJ74_9BACT|nr:formyltetrahydrofolate deformylase [Aquirufa aurantiipilula]MDF5690517.1 formyltetrahydrofolate deformylase [Aquirufa aurantiipilula]
METIIKIACKDEKGLVHKITGILFEQLVNVTQTNEFVDEESDRFFMRISFTGPCDLNLVQNQLLALLPEQAEVEIIPPKQKRVLILVTKEHHCLGELLIKYQYQDLNFKVEAVIGNHDDLSSLCQQFHVPFHCISAEGLDREAHEVLLNQQIAHYQPDLIVLAKYMRILTPQFSLKYIGKLINIHHSFLPAFIGARPYQQAFNRGVKIIGATAHFVTDDLDEGPIICQEIVPVNHTYSAKDMSKAGKDVEKIVLAKALRLVLEDRVFIHQNKTILFE